MGRILDRVVGHLDIRERLLAARLQNRVPNTLLFFGPDGVGRKLTALGWAQALLCENDPSGCGECGSCLRVEKGQSEGIRFLEPEKNQIKIEQSRDVLHFLNLQALTPYRVIIIDGAHLLNPQAANALLKVLEEPPAKTVFILIAPTPRHILATLRSRSLKVSFHALSTAELAQVMPAPSWALEAAGGRVTKLKELMDSTVGEDRARILEMLSWWLEDGQSYLRPAFRERIKDKDFAETFALGLQGFFRDLESDAFNLKLAQQFPEAKDLRQRFPRAGVQEIYQLCLGLERELKAYRDSQLIFEEFWIRSRRLAKLENESLSK